MSIRRKISVLLALPICGLAVFVIFSASRLRSISSDMRNATTSTFSPMLAKDIPEMNTLNLNIILLLNADRDAYQAELAELKSSIALTQGELDEADAFHQENIDQIKSRMYRVRAAITGSEKALFSSFSKDYEIWKNHSRKSVECNRDIFRKRKRHKELNESADIAYGGIKTKVAEIVKDLSKTNNSAAMQYFLKSGSLFNESFHLIHEFSGGSSERIIGNLNACMMNIEQGMAHSPENQQKLKELKTSVESFTMTIKTLLDNQAHLKQLENKRDQETLAGAEAFAKMRDAIDKLGESLEKRIKDLAERTSLRGVQAINHIDSMANEIGLSTNLFALIGTILIILSLFLGLLYSATIIRPLQKAVNIARLIASGDLEQAMETLGHSANSSKSAKSNDETVLLISAMATMVSNLNSLVGEVQKATIDLVSTSNSITASSRDQEVTINELRAATNESVCSTRQISSTSQQPVQTMNEVAEASAKTAGLAGEGNSGLEKMEQSMQQIGSATITISSKLSVINEKTSNIGNVVSTITKVSEQTNLLSLNASIEAEKAGEFGKGFAVVAREIRRLADQTAVAALDIAKMVKEMQSSVSSGVMSMEKFSEDVKSSIVEAVHISSQIEEIIDEIQALPEKFDQVTEGMKQQALGAQQISESMSQLNDCAKNSSESVKSFNDVIRQLNQATLNLQNELAVFKVAGIKKQDRI